MRRRVLTALCFLLLTWACATHRADVAQLPIETFSGHVTMTPKGTWFTPCGSAGTARWWVTYVDAAVAQAENAKASGRLTSGERLFVRWRASRTDERLAGPGGPALLVRDIFELRAARSADCS
jgi:hypothetical protein